MTLGIHHRTAQRQPIAKKDLKLIKKLQVESIQSDWGVESLRCYDPAYETFSTLPTRQFEVVVCTDELEHITELDIPGVLEEIFFYARIFVYANFAYFPAVAMRYPKISCHLVTMVKTGRYKEFGFARNRKSVHHTVEHIA